MIVVQKTKGMEIVMTIQVCVISWMNFYFKENGGKKALLANPKLQYRVSQYGKHHCHTNNKKNRDYYKYPSLSHFSNELILMVEREAFLANPKHQYQVSQ